jgi:hypothetical protein
MAGVILVVLLTVGDYIFMHSLGGHVFVSSATMPKDNHASWKVYTNRKPKFSYQVEYPVDWSWEENRNTTSFLPSESLYNRENISIVIINYAETPPLGVEYTYTTIRTIQSVYGTILVQKREPTALNELYIAQITAGNYIAELRFSLDQKYDPVFDPILSTFRFTK